MGNLRGILLMVAAMAGFAFEDMFVKQVATRLPISQILIILGFCGAGIFAALALSRGQNLFPREMAKPILIFRNLGEAVGAVCFVSAITMIPLSTASAIIQATPLAVTLGAAVFMGAPVGWRRWSAILVGFIGVIIVVRPGMEGFDPAALLAVGAVLCMALRDLCTRAAPTHMSSLVLSGWGFAMAVFSGLFLAPISGAPHFPDTQEWLYLGGALIAGVSGYYAITAAMRTGDVAVVTPFRYTRLLFALVIGVLVFGERPDLWTLIGAGLIIASGLYTVAREQNAARRARKQPG